MSGRAVEIIASKSDPALVFGVAHNSPLMPVFEPTMDKYVAVLGTRAEIRDRVLMAVRTRCAGIGVPDCAQCTAEADAVCRALFGDDA